MRELLAKSLPYLVDVLCQCTQPNQNVTLKYILLGYSQGQLLCAFPDSKQLDIVQHNVFLYETIGKTKNSIYPSIILV